MLLVCYMGAFSQPAAPKNKEVITQKRCGTLEHEQYLRSKDPMYDIKKAEAMKTIYEKAKEMENAKSAGNPQPFIQYTIPVVFHVLWNTAAENVTDAKVTSMLAQMNMDWSRTNTDAGNTPAVWQPIAADMQIQFCLAQVDASGNPTTGIVHKNTTITDFSASGDPQYSAQGGDDAWDYNKYLNIWIANIGGGLLGYATFPPVSSNYGTVVNYISVGSLTNPAGGPFGYGRTLSHEVGHNFMLQHIWGDDGGACTGSDQVADTPNMANATSGCPSGVVTDACGAGSDGSPASNVAPGRMYQNYMDYTDDLCYNMFTAGQKAVAQSTTANYLMGLVNSVPTVCSVAPPVALDAGVASIITPSGNYCVTTFTPVVKLQNFGTTTLTSCKINSNVDGGPNTVYNWTGSLATGASANVTLASVTATAGTHTFTAVTSAPNGGTDGNTSNDQSQSTFNIGTTGSALPVAEGFEGTFPPAGWSEYNSNSNILAWQQSSYGSQGSSKSAYFNNCNPSDTTHGLRDQLRTITYNFSSATPTAGMTFDVGYAPYTPTWYTDSLAVYYSIDCGTTWNKVYQKGGVALSTVPCTMSNTVCGTYTMTGNPGCFAPTTSAAWRNELIQLGMLAGKSSVMFAFENITEYGSNLFIDNINILSTNVGVNEINLSDNISVYPNPSDGTVFVNINVANAGKVNVKIYNMLGEIISEVSDNAKNFKFNLANQSSGIYFIKVKTDSGEATKKLMLNR